ncbi:MAG: DUF3298 domain-containing protein [Candidatus Phaeomarinobacter sp.]
MQGLSQADAYSVLKLPVAVMVAGILFSAPAGAQRDAGSDAFVQSITTPQIESTISIAPEIAVEPGLGPQIISGSVGTVGQLTIMAGEDAESVPEFFRPYQVDERWEVTHTSTTYLSALGTQWLFTGGAHGNTEFSAVIWQRDKEGRGMDVPVTSFFVDGMNAEAPVWATLSGHLLAAWEAEWAKRMGQPLGEDDQSWRDGAVKTLRYRPDGYMVVTLLPSNLAEKSAGLTFHYAPYALGPYAMGTFSFDVPHVVFADYLTDDAKAIFGGEIEVVAAPSD